MFSFLFFFFSIYVLSIKKMFVLSFFFFFFSYAVFNNVQVSSSSLFSFRLFFIVLYVFVFVFIFFFFFHNKLLIQCPFFFNLICTSLSAHLLITSKTLFQYIFLNNNLKASLQGELTKYLSVSSDTKKHLSLSYSASTARPFSRQYLCLQ